MLDTDHVSYAIRGHGNVGRKLLARRPSEICISALTVAELRYGADRRGSQKLHALIDRFAENIDIMPFNGQAALEYGRLASHLAGCGTPIGQLDTLIVAHAIALGTTLVTNNMKHFARVQGLTVENWA
jgi:tRNA(fMet)-specific endonuclease VapC